MTANLNAMIKDLNFAELQALAEACSNRMEELRNNGVIELAEKIEAMASDALGMNTKQLMAAYRKSKRGKPARKRRAEGEAGAVAAE